jgi:pro-sigmaK processing inhibitor BofA
VWAVPHNAWVYAAAVLAGVLLIGRLGAAGRAIRHLVLWGAAGAALFVVLNASGASPALRVPPNPYTVGTAAVLGVPGIGLTILAHALFR